MNARELVCHALRIALEKHGSALRVLDVSQSMAITDYFVLVTAQNRRQAQAICSAIDVELKHMGVPKARIEGYQGGWWVLLDFEEIVVHIFQEDAREFYDLDQLWADAADLTDSFIRDLPQASQAPADPGGASE